METSATSSSSTHGIVHVGKVLTIRPTRSYVVSRIDYPSTSSPRQDNKGHLTGRVLLLRVRWRQDRSLRQLWGEQVLLLGSRPYCQLDDGVAEVRRVGAENARPRGDDGGVDHAASKEAAA
jgi:hypothetical protein